MRVLLPRARREGAVGCLCEVAAESLRAPGSSHQNLEAQRSAQACSYQPADKGARRVPKGSHRRMAAAAVAALTAEVAAEQQVRPGTESKARHQEMEDSRLRLASLLGIGCGRRSYGSARIGASLR